MEYFEASHTIRTQLPSVFLAGGITDCPDWQTEATRMLASLDLLVDKAARILGRLR